MTNKAPKAVVAALFILCAVIAQAQSQSSTLSGTIKSDSGQPVAGAKVSVKNAATGETHAAQTDATGQYSITGVAPGAYDVSVTATGYSTETTQVTLAAGATKALDVKLTSQLSLSSLGFSTAQTQGNALEQARLNKRSHMLQVHQKLGLITAIPMAATLISATQAGGRHSSSTGRDVHIALGSATTGLYFATAYYAIAAPRIAGEKHHGPTRFHEAMAFIHGPGMVLTPILGAMAESQRNQGEHVHGIAKYHGEVAVITAVAYGLALLSETKPGWIPGLGHKVSSFLHLGRSPDENAAFPAGLQPAAQSVSAP